MFELDLNSQMIQMIVSSAVKTVGTIEVLKNFFVPRNKKIWTIVMIPLSLIYCAVYKHLPDWVSAGILTICVCEISYECILQVFKKFVSKVSGSGNTLTENTPKTGDL